MNEEIIQNLKLEVDPNGQFGMNRQISDQLGEAIRNGTLSRGDFLPTENWMAAHLKVSRDVVRRSYDVLKKADYIEPEGRKGWIVKYSDKAVIPDPNETK